MTGTQLSTVKPMDRFKQELAIRGPMLKDLLPAHVKVEKFNAIVIAAVGANPELLECDRGSLLKACVQAAELGLSLNPTMAEGDILKVWNGKTKKNDAQFRPRYMGLMKLARQSGEVLSIESRIVREGDMFDWEYGIEKKLRHKPSGKGELTHAYCIWKLKDGTVEFEVMDREQVMKIRNRSSAKTKDGDVFGPWKTDEEEMWRKTVVRRASKYMPRSCEAFEKAVAYDNLVEGGHDVDIQDGEVIDITSDAPEETYDAETGEIIMDEPAPTEQVDVLAEKIAAKKKPAAASAPVAPKATPKVEFLDVQPEDDGTIDWGAWARAAYKVLKGLDADARPAWIEVHKQLLAEAEMVQPVAVSHINKLVEGN